MFYIHTFRSLIIVPKEKCLHKSGTRFEWHLQTIFCVFLQEGWWGSMEEKWYCRRMELNIIKIDIKINTSYENFIRSKGRIGLPNHLIYLQLRISESRYRMLSLRKCLGGIRTIDEMEVVLMQEWSEIQKKALEDLMKYIPKQIRKLLKNKGGSTKYWMYVITIKGLIKLSESLMRQMNFFLVYLLFLNIVPSLPTCGLYCRRKALIKIYRLASVSVEQSHCQCQPQQANWALCQSMKISCLTVAEPKMLSRLMKSL